MLEKQTVNLEVFRCRCKCCDKEFNVLDFPNFEYGRRLLRTEDGENCVLQICFEDNVFSEVSNMVDNILEGRKLTEIEKAKCFDEVYGLACDPIDGKIINASKIIICRYCSSRETERFEYRPPKNININVDIVTHKDWNKKTIQEKQKIISKALEKCIENQS